MPDDESTFLEQIDDLFCSESGGDVDVMRGTPGKRVPDGTAYYVQRFREQACELPNLRINVYFHKSLRIDLGFKYADIGEVAIFFRIVQAVADNELVGNGKADVIALELDFTARRLIEQRAYL